MTLDAVPLAHTIRGEGPTVVFVHGIGSRKETWTRLIDAIEDRYRCVSIDLRGHGDSPIPDVPYMLDQLVDDVEALRRDHLEVERIHIVGHSLGGMIGPRYARRFPDHAASVTLLSTAAARTADDSSRVKAVVSRMRDEGIENVLTTLVDRWYTDAFAAAHPDIITNRIDQVLTTPPEVFLSVFDVYAETEMAPWLPDVAAPCLIITGEHDPGCSPRLNEQIDGLLPDSSLHVLKDLRHSIVVEASDQIAPVLRRFLDDA